MTAGDPAEFIHEGLWTHFRCPSCDAINEVEDDLTNGEEVTCDSCGLAGRVYGR